MNQSALKTFAQDARNKLRQLIGARLDYVLTADTAELRQQAAQVNELRAALKNEGRDPLIERVAYTWFNRLAALRFMDANGYHPFGARVITPTTAKETLPELLQQARAGALDADFVAQPLSVSPGRPVSSSQSPTLGDAIASLLSGRIPVDHPEAQVFKLLLVATCNYYHRFMPFLFEKIGDATELLLPEDLLTEHSIVADFRENLADEDCREVEVIGWLYQFYISERKDAVMARKSAVPTADIPAVTQLFTPHWIVCYLVENSLGRLWLLNRPHSKLREKMPYFIDDSETGRQGDSATTASPSHPVSMSPSHPELGLNVSVSQSPTVHFLRVNGPDEIKLLDPAAGSGHMLTYAFDLLYAIYEEEGYDAPEIPGLILRHNLHGVDICDRAVALAAFALCMKARAKDNRFFRRAVQPHLISLQEIRFEEGELREYIRALNLGDLFNQPMLKLLHQFEEAKNFGALIQPCLDEAGILLARRAIEAKDLGGQLFLRETHAKVLRALEQSEYLSQRYHAVVMNPPYLGGNQMNAVTKKLAETIYPNSKADLFAMFIERAFGLALPRGFSGMVTMQSWMFLSTFEELRADLLGKRTMHNMAHLGARAFDSIGGEVVQVTAFVYENIPSPNRTTTFLRLTTGRSEAEKEKACREGIANPKCGWLFRASASDFRTIPGSPIAYWLSAKALDAFRSNSFLADLAPIREGINTGDNAQFLRFWFEVSWSRIDCGVQQNASPGQKWVPHKKGGGFRRWYGNNEYILNWDRGGADIHEFHGLPLTYNGAPVRGKAYFFKHSLSWSRISTANFCIRQYPAGFSYDSTAPSIFAPAEIEGFVLAFLNSHVVGQLMAALSPTLDYRITSVGRLPLLLENGSLRSELAGLTEECVNISRADWNCFETSWDFRDLPLLRPGLKGATMAASWRNWNAQCDAALRRMQELETENNRLFITAYGLQDELGPEVPEEQITLARADARKDIAAFLSYAVGCMMGRYSLDTPGLVLADADASVADYERIVAERQADDGADRETGRQGDNPSQSHPVSKSPSLTFAPDADGILPLLDGEWF